VIQVGICHQTAPAAAVLQLFAGSCQAQVLTSPLQPGPAAQQQPNSSTASRQRLGRPRRLLHHIHHVSQHVLLLHACLCCRELPGTGVAFTIAARPSSPTAAHQARSSLAGPGAHCTVLTVHYNFVCCLMPVCAAGSCQAQVLPSPSQPDPAAQQQHTKQAASWQAQVPTTTQQQRQHCTAARHSALGRGLLRLLGLLLGLTRQGLPAMLCLRRVEDRRTQLVAD
jgi:hypothetical protein